jgi:nitrile hydratase accessory protein
MAHVGAAAAREALKANPGLPVDTGGPVFREPWEAQAFAMAVTLHEQGLFAWPEWATELGATIKEAQAAGDPDTGETYYRHWLITLERMIEKKSIATSDDLTSYRDAWGRAAARTPHGQPIELHDADFTA